LTIVWLQKNVFTPSEILKQMGIHGGMIQYDRIAVFNDAESAADYS
jgi:hypothetical protein